MLENGIKNDQNPLKSAPDNGELTMPAKLTPPPLTEASPWQWKAVHALLCTEPKARGFFEKAIHSPNPQNAQSLAAIFKNMGESELSEVCQNVRAQYSSEPKERRTMESSNELFEATEAKACQMAEGCEECELPTEEQARTESQRLYLVNSALLHWSWGDVLFFGKGSAYEGTNKYIPLCGHTDLINGALCLKEFDSSSDIDIFLSWSDDATLRLWEVGGGTRTGPSPLKSDHLLAQIIPAMLHDNTRVVNQVLEGHTGPVRGALPLPDGRIVSWSDDHTIRLWSRNSDGSFTNQILAGHERPILEVRLLRDGRLCSRDETTELIWG